MDIRIGDIFVVPLGNGEFAYGQIILNTKPKCYIIFDYKSRDNIDPNQIINKKILLLTYTVDTFIEDGDWIIVDNILPPSNVVLPEYLIETSKGTQVMDFKGELLREATDKDKKILDTKKSVSPKVLDLAIKAKLGEGEWYPSMNILLYKGDFESLE